MRARLLAGLLLALPLAAAQPATLHVDPARSTLSYRGTSVLHSWTGTSTRVSGTVTLDPADLSTTRFTISAPVASFDSGNRARDRKMRDVTEADRFPTVTFEAQRVRVPQGTAPGTWTITGVLTFHGVRRTADVAADVTYRNGTLTAEGSFPVSLDAHGVERPRLVGIPIGDEITVRFEIVAAR